MGNTAAAVAELVDALVLGTSGKPWGFESLQPHQPLRGNNASARQALGAKAVVVDPIQVW